MRITSQSIIDDLESNRLPLPTLPEVAIRVVETADDKNASISDVAKIIATDAALAARIIQVANSALYRGIAPSESLQSAALRLGLDTLRTLVTSLAMKQLFQATNPVVDRYLRATWKQSTDVAALSTIIARTTTTLNPETALLAGLTHSIGIYPILIKAESDVGLLNNASLLRNIIFDLYPSIGGQILKNWGFSNQLVKVPIEHLNIFRKGNNGEADFVDIVQVALLKTLDDAQHPFLQANPAEFSSLDRLGMREADEEITLVGGIAEVEEIRAAIG